MESLVQDGDELIVVRGFDADDLRMYCHFALVLTEFQLTISMLASFPEKETHEELREEAKDLMKSILDKNSEYEGRSVCPYARLYCCVVGSLMVSIFLIQLSVIVEFMAGKITETIERLIALYRPDSLIVGSRGPRSTLKTWGAALGAPGMGSVSRYGNPQKCRKTFLIRTIYQDIALVARPYLS